MKKVIKYSVLSLVALAAIASLSYNGYGALQGYANSLRVEGYTEALRQIEVNLVENGQLVLNRVNEEGVSQPLVLVPVQPEPVEAE